MAGPRFPHQVTLLDGADGSFPSAEEDDAAIESGEGGAGNGIFRPMSVNWGGVDGLSGRSRGKGAPEVMRNSARLLTETW